MGGAEPLTGGRNIPPWPLRHRVLPLPCLLCGRAGAEGASRPCTSVRCRSPQPDLGSDRGHWNPLRTFFASRSASLSAPLNPGEARRAAMQARLQAAVAQVRRSRGFPLEPMEGSHRNAARWQGSTGPLLISHEPVTTVHTPNSVTQALWEDAARTLSLIHISEPTRPY